MASQPKDQHCYLVHNFAEFEALARRALHEGMKERGGLLKLICCAFVPDGRGATKPFFLSHSLKKNNFKRQSSEGDVTSIQRNIFALI